MRDGRRRFLAIGAALLSGLALAEIVARASESPPLAPPRSDGEVLVESEDPARGWMLVPGARLTLHYPQGAGRERVVTHDVGPHGWRGAVFSPEKRPGSTRIATVGDSHTFGWGVAEDETLAVQLERELRSRGGDVEVLNLGIPNTNIEEKAWVVEHIALPAQCDVVVLQLHFDDNALDGVELGRRQGLAWAAGSRGNVSQGRLDWWREQLASVRLVTDNLKRQRASRAYASRHLAAMRPGHPARERVDAALARVRRVVEARGATVLAVLYPLPMRDASGWASAALDEQLEDATRAAGLAVLSMAAAFDACDSSVFVHPLDPHVDALAQHAAAEATALRLVELGLVPGARRQQRR